MNEDGLVASLTATPGGAKRGFSVILMLRYVLETCRHVDEAIAALIRIPIALPQNVTLLDRAGDYATLFLRPDRTPAVSKLRACTNHQEIIVSPPSTAMASSVERQRTLLQALDDPAMTLPDLAAQLLAPPLYSRRRESPTVYTAIYRPGEGRVDYVWPGRTWRQSFDRFEPGDYTHDYGELTP